MDANRLETPRLSLTLLSMGDVKACVDIDSDPVVTRYTGGPANRWTRPQWLETWIKAGRPPRYGLWLVREHGDDTALGWCGLFRLPPQNATEIALVRPLRTEAVTAPGTTDSATPAPAPPPGNYDILNDYLQPQAGGPIELLGDNQRVTIRINSDNMFGVGSATVKSDLEPIIGDIANGLSQTTGHIRVIGHTDSVPISA